MSDPLHFKRWKYESTLSPSAVLSLQNRCGIYVLEFGNDEQYVGQAVDFPSRLTTHRRKHLDIVAINFAEVARGDLNTAEYDEVQRRLDAGIHLRNKTLLAQPLGDSPLDAIVDRQVQEEWLFAPADDDADIFFGDRAELARRRAHSRASFDELSRHPYYADILDSLASYVGEVIPWSHQTEGTTWTVSAMPSTARSKGSRRLATLNVNNVEMLYVFEERHGDELVPTTVLNVAADVVLPDELGDFLEVGDIYRSAGRTALIAMEGFPTPELLEMPAVRLAARSLALGQLRKGRGMLSRFHNDALADAIYLRLDELLSDS